MLDRFQQLVEEHQDRVFTLACYLLKDREEAADATQEVLLRLWKNMGRLLGDGGDGKNGEDRPDSAQIRSWLLRVTRNHCFDQMRRRKTQRAVLGQPSGPEPLDWEPCDAPGPERRATSSALAAQLSRAVAALDEPYRSVIVLREIQELKYQEISDTLEMPINTVKVNIHRGRRMLRERMRDLLGQDPLGAVG